MNNTNEYKMRAEQNYPGKTKRTLEVHKNESSMM